MGNMKIAEQKGNVVYDRIRRGDILVVETAWNTSPFSWTIRLVQKKVGYPLPDRKSYHWAIVINDNLDVLEAEPFRVRKGNVGHYKNIHIFRHCNIQGERQRSDLAECAKMRKDNLLNVDTSRIESKLKRKLKAIARRFFPYDEGLIIQLLLQSMGWTVKLNSPTEDICTEFVILIHAMAGMHIPQNYYPASIWDAWKSGWVIKVDYDRACDKLATKQNNLSTVDCNPCFI